ncbi:MAG: hypothetical protein R3C56_02325 [Pirellulaceae bacterium]
MIGLLVVQAVWPEHNVFAVDLEDNKLELAKSLGADEGAQSKSAMWWRKSTTDRWSDADVSLEVVGATPQ